MERERLLKYAELIARCGVNVQKGQDVLVVAGLDQPEFVTMVVEACYKLGARKVVVDWSYQPVSKLHAKHRSLATMSKLDIYEEARWQYQAEKLPCRIWLESDDPDGMKGVNQVKMAKAQQKLYPIVRKYRDQMENRHQWCIAAVPGVKWAKKIFPKLSDAEAVEKLWEAILYTSRVTEDPIAAWDEHNKELHDRCTWLNSLDLRALHYTSANGTDLTVGLIPDSKFLGGGDTSLQGIFFNPNIPSEECFISPKRGEADGIVYSTRPLAYQNQLIDKFWIRFEKGKAVEWGAEKNEKSLSSMLTMDEGAGYLGECALVPYDSPISNSGILFYNTLFDENAACHLAVGRGFMDTIKGYETKTKEECEEMGINNSMIHVDFMIGSADLNIDGITADGKTVSIFKNGNWSL